MKHSLKVGLSFGLASGVTTTLGLIVGLYSSTNSKMIILGGILTIAVADAFSDALGIHISEETENEHTTKEIWLSTVSTFLSKFLFASSFIIPILLFELSTAVLVSVIYGLLLLSIFTYIIYRKMNEIPWKPLLEHLLIVLIVISLTYYIGNVISEIFR